MGSVLGQTVADLEVLVIGDGAADSTREWAEAAGRTDARVRWFGFPKDARRGERHRHQVLTEEAGGDIVLYLCDRDLWLPGHVAEMQTVLDGADFGHTLRFVMAEDDRPRAPHTLDLRERRGPGPGCRRSTNVLPLSMAGHTLAAYRRLPHGWRETPPDRPTDRHMWVQFLDQPEVRVAASAPGRPSSASSARGTGRWPSASRCWSGGSPRIADPGLAVELTVPLLEEIDRRRLGPAAGPRRGPQSRIGTWAVGSGVTAGVYRRCGARAGGSGGGSARLSRSRSDGKPSARSATTVGANGHSIPSSGSDQWHRVVVLGVRA